MILAQRPTSDDAERLFAIASWQLAGSMLVRKWSPFHLCAITITGNGWL